MDKAKTNKKKLERAKELDKKFKNLRVSFRAHWSIYGRMGIEFERLEMFKLLGFGSMKAYLKSLPDACYSTIAEAMNVQKAFPKMGVAELAQFPKENLKIIKNLPESKRFSPRVLQAARQMKASDLRAEVNKKFNVMLEKKVRLIFDVEASAVGIVEQAIEKMIAEVEASEEKKIGRGEALEYICAEKIQR